VRTVLMFPIGMLATLAAALQWVDDLPPLLPRIVVIALLAGVVIFIIGLLQERS
jgi:hypothetical protein